MSARIAKSYELQFQEGRTWIKLPLWAKFLIQLGSSIAQARTSDRRIIAAISVPTISYASAFVSLGRVLGEQIQEPAKSAVDAHFKLLAGLRHGTLLVYFNGKALFRGPFLGIVRCHDEECILIDIKGGKCIVPKARCLLVELQPESQDGLPIVTKNGRLRNPKPFVSQFFSLTEHYRVLCSTEKPVIVVGEKNRLRTELISPVLIPNGINNYEGTLQDVIRVAKFSAGGIGCRADVLARSRGHVGPASLNVAAKALVIFDGVVSVINWSHKFPSSDLVSILVRTEAEFGMAIDMANSRYGNRLDDCTLPGLDRPPLGVDIMAHVERR